MFDDEPYKTGIICPQCGKSMPFITTELMHALENVRVHIEPFADWEPGDGEDLG